MSITTVQHRSAWNDCTPAAQEFIEGCAQLLTGEHRLGSVEESSYAARLLSDVVDDLLDGEERAAIRRRVLEHLAQTAAWVREGVNPSRGLSPDRQAVLERIARTYHGQNIRHLELGTYDAFPDARVDQIKRDQGVAEFLRLDISPEFGPDVVADCTRLPFRDESLDSICSNSVFEHVAFPHEVIAESFRVLSPGGVMQVTMPFHFVQHYCPKDYLRLSPHFFEDVCREAGFEEVYCHVSDFAGLYYTLHNCSKAALVDDSVPEPRRTFYRVLHHNVVAMLALATAMDDGFQGKGAQFFVSVYCAALKGGRFQGRGPAIEGQPLLPRMLPYLASPDTGEPLDVLGQHTLATPDRAHQYPVRQGIPWLLPNTTPRRTPTSGRRVPNEPQRRKSGLRRAWRGLGRLKSRLAAAVRRLPGGRK